MSLAGFSGHLLSSAFLSTRVAAITAGSVRAMPRPTTIGPASSLRAIEEAGLTPLLEWAGATGSDLTAILIVPWGTSLHLHWRSAIEHALRRSARWCLLFNGTAIRLVDTRRPHASRFVEFDLSLTAEDNTASAALRLIVGGLAGPLDTLIRESDEHGTGVCRSLREGVLSASSDMLAALVRRKRTDGLDSALEQSLTIVYRVLFLLFAESRGLVPLWHPLYRRSYSIDALVIASARGSQARGLWDALRAIARLAHAGCRAGDLRVTPFNGRLFSPGRTPLADRRDLDDERAKRALLALATRATGSAGSRERIVYRDLGVEQLGGVYESLLDYKPSADPVRLVPGSGVRKSTGTFYTPQPIAEYLVRATLEPLVKKACAEDILRLRVVDPSMGSGAFLVAACHYLAHAYETALVDAGALHPADLSDADRASMRRTIAERCLYGVDINPMAVQLARLSVWLTTLAADRPLTFLDHRLRTGDSLLGAWVDCLRRQPSSAPRPRRHDAGHLPLFDDAHIERTLRDVLPVRFSLETADDTLAQVRSKERALTSLERDDSALSRWRRVADTWCAAWLSGDGDGIPAAAFGALTDQVLTGHCALPAHTASSYLRRAAAIADARRLFHWELEFPEVFFDATGRRLPRAGFDAVIGNPPWEVVRGDEGARRFHRSSGIFSAAVTGHGNLYQLFTERAISLLRDGGRVGLVLPSGLATDHNAAPLRQRLLRDCDVDAIVSFDNHRGVFAIHRSVKFLLSTATKGSPTINIGVRLGESDPAVLDTQPSASRAFPVRLTPAFLRRISGESLAIPELRSEVDVAIVERAATLFPALADSGGWRATFGREVNATDDASHFGAAGLPVIDGKHIEPFRAHTDATGRFISVARARALLPTLPFEHSRLAYRDVASATNKLTLIAAILPAGCVSTHTLFCLRERLRPAEQHFLCGLFNSLVVNYLVRMRVTTHVTTATVERLPIPPPGFSPSAEREIAALARLLAKRFDLDSWVRLNTQAAALYQLSADEFRHALGTFPLIPSAHRQAALQTYEP